MAIYNTSSDNSKNELFQDHLFLMEVAAASLGNEKIQIIISGHRFISVRNGAAVIEVSYQRNGYSNRHNYNGHTDERCKNV